MWQKVTCVMFVISSDFAQDCSVTERAWSVEWDSFEDEQLSRSENISKFPMTSKQMHCTAFRTLQGLMLYWAIVQVSSQVGII